jgi:uncharacterized protein (TIGR02588 family)
MKEGKNALEWIVFALSAALIVATVVFLARDAITSTDVPPTFRVDVQTTPRDTDVLLRLRVFNDGASSAEHVRVAVHAEPNVDQDVELDFVPRASSRDAFVALPKTATGVHAHVVTWVAP